MNCLLNRLRPELAERAQFVLDSWKQDEEGFDSVFGFGGVCDEIAHQWIQPLLGIPGCVVLPGDQPGEGHAWLVALFPDGHQVLAVDLPSHIYEVRKGPHWLKIEGVIIDPLEVVIEVLPWEGFEKRFLRYQYDTGQITFEEFEDLE